MAEFQELVKNFQRIRDYMRQFYVYGFKVRGDYTEKSARTYDNERRRIESWLSPFIYSEYTSKGRQVSITHGEGELSSNPLFAAWKSKSFTDNDLLLHFFILALLSDGREMTAGELADAVSGFGGEIDSQTARLKLKEYEDLGVLTSRKEKKSLLYRLSPKSALRKRLEEDPEFFSRFHAALSFFSQIAPFGFIGSTIEDKYYGKNTIFSFKHYFIVHTLEDGILYPLLNALHEGRFVLLTNHSARSGRVTEIEGLPLKVFVSTRTGRRYICVYTPRDRRFVNLRLDCISSVQPLDLRETSGLYQEKLSANLSRCFGVSFGSPASRVEEIFVKLAIDDEKEGHILNRLFREGRGGEIIRIDSQTFLYSGFFFDVGEMLSWVKSFTGRILDIQSSNREAMIRITTDLEILYRMYCQDPSEAKTF